MKDFLLDILKGMGQIWGFGKPVVYVASPYSASSEEEAVSDSITRAADRVWSVVKHVCPQQEPRVSISPEQREQMPVRAEVVIESSRVAEPKVKPTRQISSSQSDFEKSEVEVLVEA